MQQITGRNGGGFSVCALLAVLFPAVPAINAQAQLSLSAYRALGQVDLRQNGVNMVGPGTLYFPQAAATDHDGHLYVADGSNQRILGWSSVTGFQNGDPATIVLGQPNFQQSNPYGIGSKGFNFPWSLAVDPTSGNLYAADLGSNRVLRFPKPFANPTRVEPDAVYGQPDFVTHTANSAGVTDHTMSGPRGVAFDGAGNLWVADSGNNRILHFPAGVLNNQNPSADFALGQPDLHSSGANASGAAVGPGGFSAPTAMAFDAQNNLYVADYLNTRILKFPAPVTGASLATVVYGERDMKSRGVPQAPTSSSMAGPAGVAVDSKGTLYVAVPFDNRILVFAPNAASGAAATAVLGQPNFTAVTANTGSFPQASAGSLSGVAAVAVDAADDLIAADVANQRVLLFARGVSTASRVLGQTNFAANGPNQIKPGSVNAPYLHAPSGLAIAPNGNLFVSDNGNNRVLEFAAGSATGASAIRVYGQPDFNTSAPPTQVSAQNLSVPAGLFVDAAFNLYVADSGANRVLIFPNTRSAPPAGLPASIVFGQTSFATSSVGAGPAGLRAPLDVSLDSVGNVFVSDAGNNRVVVYPSLLSLTPTGASAYLAIGQPNLETAAANWNTPDGLATPQGLYAPVGIFVDRRDTLYVGDAGNNRVVHFLKPVAVVNAATMQATVPVGVGAWCTLYGSGLSTETHIANSLPLPTGLASREVVVNDQFKAPLYYVSPGQINLVFPLHAPVGSQRIAARMADTGELLAGGAVIVAPYAPGFFTHDQNGAGQAAALNQDNSINSAANPAARGSIVQLFGTGQGPVVSPVADGQAAPQVPDNTVAQPTSDAGTCLNKQPALCIGLGGSQGGAQLAEIQYSGLAPGLVGVWQVNIKIPSSGLLGNTIAVRAIVGGANQSNLVSIAVK